MRDVLKFMIVLPACAMWVAGCSHGEEDADPSAPGPESRPAGARTASKPGIPTIYTKWPFDAKEAKRRQQETAKVVGVPVEKTLDLGKGVTMRLALIPAGRFLMGPSHSDERDDRNVPRHEVTISQPFRLGVTEVTQAQWKAAMGTEPWKGQEHVKEGGDNAANCTSWDDAVAFCKAMSTKTGRSFRLPTEAEWEYACRAGAATMYCFGNDHSKLSDYAWHAENAWNVGNKYAHAVARKEPNAWGLCDMHGNVYEWCSDWYAKGYYRPEPVVDPQGPASGEYRVLRGGGFGSHGRGLACRSAIRGGYGPDARFSRFGFRVVVSLASGVD